MGDLSGNTTALNIGLAGQPNTGKSTLFNRLTGARQHVGNWPGKTVEQKYGVFLHKEKTIKLVDLPGTYSLSANSAEELISRNQIVSDETDALIVMVDASQLQRSMYLLAEITGINIPVVVVCTMVDVAEKQGKSIDIKKLEQKLGVPVAAINAARGEGIEALKDRMTPLANQTSRLSDHPLAEKYRYVIGETFHNLVKQLPKYGIEKYSAAWLATRLIEGDSQITELVKTVCEDSSYIKIKSILSGIEDGALGVANARYAWIEEMLVDVVSRDKAKEIFTVNGFDRLATHWFLGKALAVFMIFFGFAASILLVSPVLFSLYYFALPILRESVSQTLAASEVPLWINSFVSDALIPGAGIAIMTVLYVAAAIFFFGVMENIGYVSRIAYVFDHLMGRLGLHGKSVLAFISGFICNIVGVVGARVIDSDEQRRTTIVTSLAIPCMSCWGVILLVASIFFRTGAIWIVMSLFLVTIIHIGFTAWLFRDRSTNRKDAPGLIMELPPYHSPSWKAVLQFVISRMKNAAIKAGTAIFIAVVLIWVLTYSSTGNMTGGLLYQFGKAVEPISMLIGFDWRLLIAIIFSTFAKEAALGVIAILFGVGELGTSLSSTVVTPVMYNAGELTHAMGNTLSKASALAFVFAYYFNVPCIATIAIIRSETHSTRFAVLVAGYYILAALVIAGIAYRVGLIIF